MGVIVLCKILGNLLTNTRRNVHLIIKNVVFEEHGLVYMKNEDNILGRSSLSSCKCTFRTSWLSSVFTTKLNVDMKLKLQFQFTQPS